MQTRLPHVFLVATGGTIAGYAADAASSLHYRAGVLAIGDLLSSVPDLTSIASVQAEQLAEIDSKDMHAGLWCRLAERINTLLARPDTDGVVVTHGTDTLEETAYFLHLTVKSRKPVVLTAAMRPATALSADGPANLLAAIRVAAAPHAQGHGALVVMNNQIYSARDVTKSHTYSVDSFRSLDLGPLGWVLDGDVCLQRTPMQVHTMDSPFEVPEVDAWPWVEIVTSHVQAGRAMVDALVAAGVQGLVVAGTGNGTMHDTLYQGVQAAMKRGVSVVRASRTGSGSVVVGGCRDGTVAAGTLNPYKARVLLQLALHAHVTASTPIALQQVFDLY